MRTLALATVCLLALAACGGDADSESPKNATVQRTALAEAEHRCASGGTLGDSDLTLVIQTAGEEDSEGMSFDDLECYFAMLEMPDSVKEHLNTTRAMDGRQEDKWGSFKAGWTYHPDSGLSLTITTSKK